LTKEARIKRKQAYGSKNRLTKEASIKINKNISKTDNQTKPKNG
jgi:hypothetical protein